MNLRVFSPNLFIDLFIFNESSGRGRFSYEVNCRGVEGGSSTHVDSALIRYLEAKMITAAK